MFCYIYGDIFWVFSARRAAKDAGREDVVPLEVTQKLLVGTSVFMAIPAAMVFLSLALTPKLDRWVNIVLGVIYTAVVLVTMPGAWPFYIFLGVVKSHSHC
jgi:hypothetical protein